uniref:Pre-rRNA-processing protein IPI1 n=1 Tax=Rhipicephalus appendiculatus TaxID=34631 RepID=A0A131YJS4_RHIAP
MGKHKKNQKDFQKVKLKVGRKLPKGLNVTDTSFKTKKIVLHDRLSKPATGEPTTTRKLSVQDLISRLHHYNVASRMDALAGLRELGRSHAGAFSPHLKPLLEILGTLCTDKEGTVRQSALKVLRLVLGSVSSDCLSPFGPLLLSQLGCAVNHLSAAVRHDALDLLGLLLDAVPSLAVRTPYGSLCNFLNMISTSAESSAVGKHRRVLSSQLGQRHTNRAVWVRVLSSMERFLAVALRVWFPTAAEDDSPASADVAAEAKTVRVGGETSACIALYRNGLEPQPRASAFRLYDGLLSAGTSSSSGRSGAASGSNAGSSRENAREFALELVPLLLDMWVEADPDSGESMPRDSLILIDCILRVLLLLIEWLRKESPSNVSWFEENFGTLLLNHFDGRFPFSHDCVAGSGKPLTKKTKKDPLFDRQVSVASINLGICEVLAGLLGVLSADQGQQVLAFFGDLISTGQVRSGDTRVVVKIARLLLPRVSPSDCLQLVEAMLSLYEEGDILQPKDACFILDFFHELILGPRTLLEVIRPVVDRFLGLLPERALGDRGEGQEGASLRFLGKLAQLRLPALLQSLQRHSLVCIELLPQMSQEEDRRTLVELICRVPSLEKEHFEALYAATLDPLPTSIVLYLLQLLKERFDEEKKGVMYVAAYSSFLLSVATGMSRNKNEQLRAIWRDDSSWLELKELLPEVSQIPVVPIDWDLLPSHLMIIEMVAKSFEAFPASWNLSQIFEPLFQQFLEAYPQMSCSAALSIVHLCGRRRSAEQPPWLLSPPWGPLTIGCAAGLLCVAAQMSGTMPTSTPALVQALAGLATRCPNIFNDLVAQFCQVLDLPLSVPCLELVCGALRILSKQHLLSTPARNLALQMLIGKQGSELRRHPWFLATLSEFCEGVKQQHHSHQLAVMQPSSITITVRQ